MTARLSSPKGFQVSPSSSARRRFGFPLYRQSNDLCAGPNLIEIDQIFDLKDDSREDCPVHVHGAPENLIRALIVRSLFFLREIKADYCRFSTNNPLRCLLYSDKANHSTIEDPRYRGLWASRS